MVWFCCVGFSFIWSNGNLYFDGFLLFVFLQVRIQLGQGSAATVTKNMLKNEGIGAFYKVRLCKNLLSSVISIGNLWSLRFIVIRSVVKDGSLLNLV